ncbi:MAG: ankyrin repeat domain-containing protein [Candidatus Sulfopaludibacter sp.]|nr:ankyrin repeat domain-containing protein [Candidatus Sulfopaludibacter sp.]
MNANLPARHLPERPDLDQLKRQAKEMLAGFAAKESSAVAEVRQYYPGAPLAAFALHDAQLVLARAYGFDSWPKLKARVDGVTIGRLHDAVEQGDADAVRNLLQRRPELVNRDQAGYPERLPLHIAVQRRDAAMVRHLMERGADAHSGIWPYRKDTQAVVMAAERGYDEIVDIIREQELKREKLEPAPAPDAPEPAMEPAAAAVVRGDAAWIRERHAEGALRDPLTGDGLLALAVKRDRPDMLALLLELGFDPDETRRETGADEILHSWGRPLQECTQSGKLAMAEMLLAHGADANAWACVWNAYRQKDAAMIELLARYGGVPNAMTPGYLRDTELAARMFRQEDAGTLPKGTVREGRTVAEEILDPAASAGSVDILRMAMERIAWPRDDPRWWGILASPLCFWNHIPWIYSEKWDLDRNAYLPCFALVLDRCDANIRGRFGITVLHYAASSYNWVTPEERVVFVRMLLDRGARMDVRDELLQSTPLGWACRWGRMEVVRLLLERGADPVEPDAELWATPREWAEKAGHKAIVAVLQEYAPRR